MTTDLKTLTKHDLEELVNMKLMLAESKEEDALARLVETSVLLEGKKARGKTLSAVAICYQLRERFNRHVITIGSKMGLKPEFGAFENLTESQFKDALGKIQDVVDEEAGAEEVVKALRSKGVDLMYSTLVFDESYKLFDCRTPSDKLTRVFGYFMAQQRHYHCTTLLLTPNRDMIDKRVRQQLDWQGRCFHNKWTHKCTVRLVGGLETMTFTLSGIDDTYHVPYYDLYETHVLVGFRRKHLEGIE